MNLIQRLPFRTNSFLDEIDQHWHKIVDSFFDSSSLGSLKNRLKNNIGYPKLDAFTTGNTYCIQASVPGVSPDDLQVEVFNEGGIRYVRIQGKMAEDYREEGADWKIKELRRGMFERVLSLPEEIEGDPEATVKHGVLTLMWKIPKANTKSDEVKRISVKTS